MQWPLVMAALGLGAAAVPHCAVRCGAPCAAVTHHGAAHTAAFHAGRLLGYSAAGAIAASSMAALGAWAQAAPAWRPLWTLLHLALLVLGLWWLVTGQQPAWMLGRGAGVVTVRMPRQAARPVRAGLLGLAWVAWPCAALQGAFVLAALASSAAGGALVMATFAIASMPGLAAAPWLWGRWRAWRSWRGAAAAPGRVALLGFRGAGFGLVMVSGWALTQGIWQRVAAWCLA